MTPRERLLRVLEGREVDRVPALSVTQTGTVELMKASGAYWPEAHRDAEKMARLAVAAHEFAGLEAVRVPFGMYAEPETLGCRVDYHEGRSDFHPTVVEPLPDLGKLRVAEPSERRMATVVEAVRILSRKVSGNLPIVAGAVGPFTLAGYVYGLDNLMRNLLSNSDKVHGLLETVWKVVAGFCGALAEAGADVVSLLEPTSSTIGPQFFKVFNLGYLQKVTGSVGCLTVLHVCGNSLPIVELVAESGVKGLSIDQKVSVKQAKEKAKGKIAIIGNLDPVSILLEGDPLRVESESRRVIREGVDVLAPGGGFSPYTPTANIRAMVEAARAYGSRM